MILWFVKRTFAFRFAAYLSAFNISGRLYSLSQRIIICDTEKYDRIPDIVKTDVRKPADGRTKQEKELKQEIKLKQEKKLK